MDVAEFTRTAEFRRLLDEDLRRHAEKSANEIIGQLEDPANLKSPRLVKRAQIQSIPAVLSAHGVTGLIKLAENQKAKNTKQENKCFWDYIHQHLTKSKSTTSLRHWVEDYLNRCGFTQPPPDGASRAEAGAHNNRARKVIDHFLRALAPVYFEHFVCHYYWTATTSREGGAR